METPTERPNVENPLEGSELVIYAPDESEVHYGPNNEVLEELGVVSISLWARWEDEGTELPLFLQSTEPTWLSFDVESYYPQPGEVVSEAFEDAIVEMVDDENGEWGMPERDTWDGMSEVEQYVFYVIRMGFLQQSNEYPALIIDHLTKND